MVAEWEMVYAGRWRTKDRRFEAIRADSVFMKSVSRRPWRCVDYDTGKYVDSHAPDLQSCKDSVERLLKREAARVPVTPLRQDQD